MDANLEDNLALLRYLKAQTRTYKSIGIEQLGVPDFQNEDGASYQRAIQGLLQATIDDAVMYRRIANEVCSADTFLFFRNGVLLMCF